MTRAVYIFAIALVLCYPAARPALSQNILQNSTFRIATNGSTPDFWDLHHAAALRFRSLYQQFGLDNSQTSPISNASVLRVVNSESNFPFLYLMSYSSHPTLAAGTYVFSVFIKSDRRDARVELASSYESIDSSRAMTEPVELAWRRVSATFTVKDAGAAAVSPVIVFPYRGTFWVAAPQLERGDRATAFKPAAADQYLEEETPLYHSAAENALNSLAKIVNDPPPPRIRIASDFNVYPDGTDVRIAITNDLAFAVNGTLQCEELGGESARSEAVVSALRIESHRSSVVDIGTGRFGLGTVVCVLAGYDRVATSFDIIAPHSPLIRIDRFKQVLNVNGGSFLVRGMKISSLPPDWYLEDVVSAGINTLVYYPAPAPDGSPNFALLQSLLRSAARYGLKVIVGPPVMGMRTGEWDSSLMHYAEIVDRFRDDPGVLGWFLVDEPQVGASRDSELHDLHRLFHGHDPYHPIFLNWNSDDVPSLVGVQPHGSLNSSDIYSIDYYPFMGPSTGLEIFTLRTILMLRTATLFNRPGHSWLQLYGYLDAFREPTGDELRYMAYLNFIYGAGYSYWDTKSNAERTWEALSATNREIALLADRLLANPHSTKIKGPRIVGRFLYALWK